MAINRVEIKDFLVFKGDFAADFCPGINVLIGGNGTGKTTLMKCLFYGANRFSKPKNYPALLQSYFGISEDFDTAGYGKNSNEIIAEITEKHGMIKLTVEQEVFMYSFSFFQQPNAEVITLAPVYIPEKDVLEHAKGLLTFIEDKQTGFSPMYRDLLIKAQDVPTQKQSDTQTTIGKIIAGIVGGEVKWDKSDGSFYTIKTDGKHIPFASEASGYKKLGFLGLLVASGQLESGSALFWDEPENSLNPELIPILVEILFELQRGGVQIFLATHSYTLARYFDVKKSKNKSNNVMFYNLTKENDGRVTAVLSPECRNLPKNILDEADEQLYKAVVGSALEVRN